MRWNRVWILAPVVVLALGGAQILRSRAQGPAVRVVTPTVSRVAQALAATGRVAGARESALAPGQPGVLAALYVREGDLVQAGQPVARLRDAVLREDLARAEAAVRAAEAEAAAVAADAGVRPSRIVQARAESSGAIRQAEARLAVARARLAEVESAATDDQRAEAAAAVAQAAAQRDQAQRELARARTLADANATARAPLTLAEAELAGAESAVRAASATRAVADREASRMEELFAQAAISRSARDRAALAATQAAEDTRRAEARRAQAAAEVERQSALLTAARDAEAERAQAALTVAEQAVAAARARLRHAETPRPETVRRAAAEVAEAEAAVSAARRAGPARVAVVEAGTDLARVTAAQRRAAEAAHARDAARARLNDAVIRAPFAGQVVQRLAEVGAAVGPGQPVLTLAAMGGSEVLVDLDERERARVAVGQVATLAADAFPDTVLRGRVIRVGARTDPQRGTVEVAVAPDTRPDWLTNGTTVDVNILLDAEQSRLLVPSEAVLRNGSRGTAFVVRDGRAEERALVLGVGGAGGVLVLEGLREGEAVAGDPLALRNGQRVRVTGATP